MQSAKRGLGSLGIGFNFILRVIVNGIPICLLSVLHFATCVGLEIV